MLLAHLPTRRHASGGIPDGLVAELPVDRINGFGHRLPLGQALIRGEEVQLTMRVRHQFLEKDACAVILIAFAVELL